MSVSIDSIGSGSREIFVVPGIVDAPGDWKELAKEMGASLCLLQKPKPEKGKQDEEAWRSQWRESLQALLRNADVIMAHSAGGLDVLHIAHALRAKLLILLAPPTQKSFSILKTTQAENHWQEPEKRMTHELLAPLCDGMDPETYRAMLDRHAASYGTHIAPILKRERPNESTVTIEKARELLRSTGFPVVVIDGKKDPWSHPVRRDSMTKGFGHVTVHEVDTGHFPHVERPSDLNEILAEKY